MPEKQEKVHVVVRRALNSGITAPVKVFDDRADARAYVRRLNQRATKYRYRVVTVRKG